jgi:hypothetical protein
MLRIVCILIAAGGLLWAGFAWTTRDPSVAFLVDENGAQWIQHDEPVRLSIRSIEERTAGFGKIVRVEAEPERAILNVRALRSVQVLVDGVPVFSSPADPAAWTHRHEIDLAPWLSPGEHALALMVRNSTGPASVLAYSEALGIRTGADWEASIDGRRWTAARPASQIRSSALSREFPHAGAAFLETLPVLGPVFLIVFLAVALRRPAGFSIEPAALRWLLLAAWALLALNNLVKLPRSLGFDVNGHLAYIRLVAEQHRIPLPTEGWTTFQAPFYYLLSAPLYTVLDWLVHPDTALRLLRLLPLASGLAAIEVCYRILRRLWPGDGDRQRAGLLFAALCPMSLYLSPFVGNELLAALLVALALALAMHLVHDPAAANPRRDSLWIGLFLGLGLLTKLTVIALIPPMLAAVGWAAWQTGGDTTARRARGAAQAMASVAGLVLFLAGWYYARNWIALGRPFFGGFEPERGFAWWQDPGYRTWGHLLRFGEALGYPINSAVVGFLDGFYATFSLDSHLSSMVSYAGRPPWNYGFLLAGAWWGLVPVTLIGVGSFSAIRSGDVRLRRVALLCAACLAALLAGMLYGFLRFPYYCTVKATYTLGLLPAYAVLLAIGFGAVARRRIARAVVYGLLVCWGLSAYLAYWVV